ncbi:hypothetical protein GY12_15555 [Micrococcus luteus]|nr:hypothetical protein GY12_15555 [Micrococcus luteus]
MAGSPGPLDRKTPSGSTARMPARSVAAGSTCTRMPREARCRGVAALMPRSRAAISAMGSPSQPCSAGSMTYGSSVVTDSARRAPAIDGWARTSASSSASGRAACSPENTPARIEPSVRRRRVMARGVDLADPDDAERLELLVEAALARQLDGRRAASRTT